MANFHSYSTSSWRWIVWRVDASGKVNRDSIILADFAAKWEADKYAAEHGGVVKKIRW